MTDLNNHDLFHLLFQKNRSIKKQLDTGLNAHNLYMSQWSIIFALYQFGSMTQTDIWTYFNVEAPTVTRTLERMKQNGWIKSQSGDDKRTRIIVLTQAAQEAYASIKQDVAQMEADLLHQFTEADKQQLYHLLQKIEA